MKLSISKTRQFAKRGVSFAAYVVLVPTLHELKLIEKYRLDGRIVWPDGHVTVTDLLIGIDLNETDVLVMERTLDELSREVKQLVKYIRSADHFYGDVRDEIR